MSSCETETEPCPRCGSWHLGRTMQPSPRVICLDCPVKGPLNSDGDYAVLYWNYRGPGWENSIGPGMRVGWEALGEWL